MCLKIPRREEIYTHKDGGRYIIRGFGIYKHPVTREWISLVGYTDVKTPMEDEWYWRELPDFSTCFTKHVAAS